MASPQSPTPLRHCLRRSSDTEPHRMPKLPLEVLAEIMSFGSQTEMRSLTTVSRDFYDATRLAGLYIHRTIRIDIRREDVAARLIMDVLCFAEIVLHAAQHDRLLSLVLDFPNSRGEDTLAESDLPDMLLRVIPKLALIIGVGLRKLVKLSIVVPPPIVDLIIQSLCKPAPVLNEFTLKCDQGLWQRHPPHHSLSPQLFKGQASNLRRVSLSSISLGAMPLPAFAGIRTAWLGLAGSLELDVAAHFPRAVDLEFRHTDLGEDAQVARLRFTGLAVQRLLINEDTDSPSLLLPAISRGLRLHSVPEMHLYSHFDDSILPFLCPASPGAVAVRLWPGPPSVSMTIMVSSLEKNWKRLLHYGWWLADEGIPSSMEEFAFHASITYLRLENSYIDGLLQAQLVLEALEHVRIDLPTDAWPTPGMLWAPAWEDGVSRADKLPESWCYEAEYPSYWLMCPRLKTLSLFAIDEPMVVHPHELAYLGCALGQEYVMGYEKTAHLVLVGVSFPEGSSPVLIDVTFSVVKKFEFGTTGLPEDLDSDLWEYQWNPVED